MTIKKRSTTIVLFFLVLFIISAFALLSLQNETFAPLTLLFGVVLSFFIVFQYNLLKKAFKHLDRMVLLAAQFLWSMGLVIIYRIDENAAFKQFLYLLIGSVLLVMIMLLVRKSTNFGKLNWFFMAATGLLLVSTLVLGRSVGGAKNWLRLGPLSFQPSEFAKILFIVVSAYFLSTREKLSSFIPYMAFTAACVIIQVIAKDLGSALLIAGVFLIMFYSATGRKWLTLTGLGVLGAGAFLSYHLFSHVRTRVEVWLDPWANYSTNGYQIVQGLLALASGGLLGRGLGNGMPSVIPASKTDYIFTVIGEEFGVIVGVMVIAFYLVFIIRGMLIAIDTDNSFDALLVFGCTAMLALQSFIIIGGVIKLIPLTGITLPFISYGGSSLLSSMIMLGIIEGVAVKNGKRDEQELEMMGGRME